MSPVCMILGETRKETLSLLTYDLAGRLECEFHNGLVVVGRSQLEDTEDVLPTWHDVRGLRVHHLGDTSHHHVTDGRRPTMESSTIIFSELRGFNIFFKIRDNFGLTRGKNPGKSSENSPIFVLIFGVAYTMCILFVCTLLKVVGHYDLSVLSLSVMGFQNKLKSLYIGWVDWVSYIQFLLDFSNLFNFAKPLNQSMLHLPMILPPGSISDAFSFSFKKSC